MENFDMCSELTQELMFEIEQTVKYHYLDLFQSHSNLIEENRDLFSNNQKIYQYCGESALKNILINHQLQATNLAFLAFNNDDEEFLNGLDILITILENTGHEEENENNRLASNILLEAMKKKRDEIKLITEEGKYLSPYYARSFSLEGDKLSQWELYGDYSIGFDSRYLLALIESKFMQGIEVTASKIVYDESYKCGVLDKFIVPLLVHIENQRNYRMYLDDNESREYLIRCLIAFISDGHIDDLLGSLKHEKFKEENEVRLFLKNIPEELVNYREESQAPYINLGFDNEKLPIKEIIISPILLNKQSLDEIKITILELLKEGGYKDDEVNIIDSKISYRYNS
jgi:hypothetical protein